jgi:glycosyltransferase involved in cell wall biosynthesis
MLPLVSVIVPFFEHHAALPGCLTALSLQTYPATCYEVIVVDNSVEDGALDLSRFPAVKLHREPQPGSYAARNKGISVALGQIFAFTDADCVPHSDWIEKGVARLACLQRPALVGGHIQMTYLNPAMPRIVELYDAIANLRQEFVVTERHFAVTANAFASRKVFEEVGVFDPRLKSNGDWEWGQRVYKKQIVQVFAAEVIVEHAARASLRALMKQVLRTTGGMVDRAPSERAGLSAIIPDLVIESRNARQGWKFVATSPLASTRTRARLAALHSVVVCARIAERLRLRRGGTSRRA